MTALQQAQMAEIEICVSIFPLTVIFIHATFALKKLSWQTPWEWSCWICLMWKGQTHLRRFTPGALYYSLTSIVTMSLLSAANQIVKPSSPADQKSQLLLCWRFVCNTSQRRQKGSAVAFSSNPNSFFGKLSPVWDSALSYKPSHNVAFFIFSL